MTLSRAASRLVTIALVAIAVVVLALVLLGGSGEEQTLRLRLQNASQLVPGNEVKVGGLGVGTVKDIALADDGQAEITAQVTDAGLVPLHRGTRAIVRVSSLSGVASRYVALEPGPNDAPELADDAVIQLTDTQPAVDLDAVLSTLDADTRSHMQRLSRGGAAIYEGGGANDLNRGLVALNPAVAQLDATLSELSRDRAAFERFVVSGAGWVSAVAEREADLEGGLAAAAGTAQAIAADSEALQSLLVRAPRTLRQAGGTLVRTGRTLDAIGPAVREAGPVAPRISRLLADLDPTLDRLKPALRDVRPLVDDLGGYLKGTNRTREAALPAFRAATGAIEDSLPILTGARPFWPDILLGATNGFGGTAAGPYDANGGYGRIGATAGAFSASGPLSLLPTVPTGYRPFNTKRCPGAATQVAPDGSNRFDPGIPCDESHRP